jgi:ribokinase
MREFVAIGDTVIDTFIKLGKAEVIGTPDQDDYKLCIPFAEKIPYESLEVVPAVGNAANAAVAAARLGLNSSLVSDLGEDAAGKDCIAALEASGVDISLIETHPGMKTNQHYVLWYQADRTILVKHEDYDYRLPNIGEPKWVYLSSLGPGSVDYHTDIINYLNKHPSISLAFQPGTFQISLGKEKLKDIYERTTIFFCNIEEAGRILGVPTLGTEELLKRMHALGPKIVVLTDGPKGAYAYAGEEVIFQAPRPDPKPPLERTGAGDAFAATVVAALSLGEDLKTALAWAAVNSMSVVQYVGAQRGLLSKEDIKNLMKKGAE